MFSKPKIISTTCSSSKIISSTLIPKIISTFFIKAQNYFFYLKGVRHRDMINLLQFMYHGEVNVVQDDINQFLATAEELQIRGLTHDNNDKEKEIIKKVSDTTSDINNSSGGLKIKSEPNLSDTSNFALTNSDSVNTSEDIVDDDIAVDKTEFEDNGWSRFVADEPKFPCPICNKVFRSKGSLASHKYAYHKDSSPSSQKNPLNPLNLNPFQQGLSMIPPASMIPPNPLQMLDFQMDSSNMDSIRDKDIECPICHKFFSTKGSLATHKYNYHRTGVNNSNNINNSLNSSLMEGNHPL